VFAILVAVMALVMPMASPAAATSPTMQETPFPSDGIWLDGTLHAGSPFPPALVCAFPVLITALQDNAKLITFYNSQGQPRFSITNGALKLRLTRTDNNKTLDLNASGPGRISADGTTLTTWGPWLTFLPTPWPTAPSQLFFTTGQSVFDYSVPSFRLISGRTVDLCSQLA